MDTFGNVTANSDDIRNAEGDSGNAENAGAHAKIDAISGAARTAVDSLSSGAHESFDKAVNVANQAAETIETKQAELKIAQAKLLENCRGYVQENPLMSLGIATAFGYVLRRLLKSH